MQWCQDAFAWLLFEWSRGQSAHTRHHFAFLARKCHLADPWLNRLIPSHPHICTVALKRRECRWVDSEWSVECFVWNQIWLDGTSLFPHRPTPFGWPLFLHWGAMSQTHMLQRFLPRWKNKIGGRFGQSVVQCACDQSHQAPLLQRLTCSLWAVILRPLSTLERWVDRWECPSHLVKSFDGFPRAVSSNHRIWIWFALNQLTRMCLNSPLKLDLFFAVKESNHPILLTAWNRPNLLVPFHWQNAYLGTRSFLMRSRLNTVQFSMRSPWTALPFLLTSLLVQHPTEPLASHRGSPSSPTYQ